VPLRHFGLVERTDGDRVTLAVFLQASWARRSRRIVPCRRRARRVRARRPSTNRKVLPAQLKEHDPLDRLGRRRRRVAELAGFPEAEQAESVATNAICRHAITPSIHESR